MTQPAPAANLVEQTPDGGLRTRRAGGVTWVLAGLPVVLLVPRALLVDSPAGRVLVLLLAAVVVGVIVPAILRVGTTLSPDGRLVFRGVATTRTLHLSGIGDAVVIGLRNGGMTTLNLIIRGPDGKVLHRVQDAPANPTVASVSQVLELAGIPVGKDPRGVIPAAHLDRFHPGAGRWSDRSGALALMIVGAVVLIGVLVVVLTFLG